MSDMSELHVTMGFASPMSNVVLWCQGGSSKTQAPFGQLGRSGSRNIPSSTTRAAVHCTCGPVVEMGIRGVLLFNIHKAADFGWFWILFWRIHYLPEPKFYRSWLCNATLTIRNQIKTIGEFGTIDLEPFGRHCINFMKPSLFVVPNFETIPTIPKWFLCYPSHECRLS